MTFPETHLAFTVTCTNLSDKSADSHQNHNKHQTISFNCQQLALVRKCIRLTQQCSKTTSHTHSSARIFNSTKTFNNVIEQWFSTILLEWNPLKHLDCMQNLMQWHKSLFYLKRTETLVGKNTDLYNVITLIVVQSKYKLFLPPKWPTLRRVRSWTLLTHSCGHISRHYYILYCYPLPPVCISENFSAKLELGDLYKATEFIFCIFILTGHRQNPWMVLTERIGSTEPTLKTTVLEIVGAKKCPKWHSQ